MRERREIIKIMSVTQENMLCYSGCGEGAGALPAILVGKHSRPDQGWASTVFAV